MSAFFQYAYMKHCPLRTDCSTRWRHTPSPRRMHTVRDCGGSLMCSFSLSTFRWPLFTPRSVETRGQRACSRRRKGSRRKVAQALREVLGLLDARLRGRAAVGVVVLRRPRVALAVDAAALAKAGVRAHGDGLAAAEVRRCAGVRGAVVAWLAASELRLFVASVGVVLAPPGLAVRVDAAALLVLLGALAEGRVVQALRVVVVLLGAVERIRAAGLVVVRLVPRRKRRVLLLAAALPPETRRGQGFCW